MLEFLGNLTNGTAAVDPFRHSASGGIHPVPSPALSRMDGLVAHEFRAAES